MRSLPGGRRRTLLGDAFRGTLSGATDIELLNLPAFFDARSKGCGHSEEHAIERSIVIEAVTEERGRRDATRKARIFDALRASDDAAMRRWLYTRSRREIEAALADPLGREKDWEILKDGRGK